MLSVTYETAWFLFHRLREAAVGNVNAGPLGGQNAVVEGDETYVGGKEANKHVSKRKPGRQGDKGKQAVFALVERDGMARPFHVANVTGATLRPIMVKHASRKSHLMTDESWVYTRVGEEFAGHSTVNQFEDEYVRHGGFTTTNTVESYFAILKRCVYCTFHSISEAHLHRYLAEFDFRYNHRDVSDVERAEALMRGAKGKRVYYRQPDEASHA